MALSQGNLLLNVTKLERQKHKIDIILADYFETFEITYKANKERSSMYTVIVADDEEEIRNGIIRRVEWERVGFQIIGEAQNGADALELVEKLEPDLLITDIRMPFLSGIELARAIREVRPTVQIAF